MTTRVEYETQSITNVNDVHYISGMISGDGTEHKPWWMEGNAVYFSHLHYSRATGDFEHLYNEMKKQIEEEKRKGFFETGKSTNDYSAIDKLEQGK